MTKRVDPTYINYMKTTDYFWAVVEAVCWYTFIYLTLYAIKNPVDLYQYSLYLLVILYVGTVSCPWFRNTDAWQKLWKK